MPSQISLSSYERFLLHHHCSPHYFVVSDSNAGLAWQQTPSSLTQPQVPSWHTATELTSEPGSGLFSWVTIWLLRGSSSAWPGGNVAGMPPRYCRSCRCSSRNSHYSHSWAHAWWHSSSKPMYRHWNSFTRWLLIFPLSNACTLRVQLLANITFAVRFSSLDALNLHVSTELLIQLSCFICTSHASSRSLSAWQRATVVLPLHPETQLDPPDPLEACLSDLLVPL